MADIVFNNAKGRVAELAKLAPANSALIAVPIEATGIEDDATLEDYDSLDALLAGASVEQTDMGRETLTNVTSAPNDTDNRHEVDADDITWTAATGNEVAAVVICYDPDTTAGDDTTLEPLLKFDMAATPSGSDITFVFNAGGVYQAS